jgi:ATP-dependent Lon protease
MKSNTPNIKNIIQIDVKKDIHNTHNSTKNTSEIIMLIEKKMLFFEDIIQQTILYVQQNKLLNILGVSEVNGCINMLASINKLIKEPINLLQIENTINSLQIINNELSSLFKTFGTPSFTDLLFVCFGNSSSDLYATNENDLLKFELLKKYFHPTSYKLYGVSASKSTTEDPIKQNLNCIDISLNAKPFYLKVYGIQVIVYNDSIKKSIIVNGIVDDVMIEYLNHKYIANINTQIKQNLPEDDNFKRESFDKFIHSLTLKDYLLHDYSGIYSKFLGYISNLHSIVNKPMPNIVKDFISGNLFIKRNTIILLLVHSDKNDNQYLAYMLYDLLSNDVNGTIDTQEQIMLFDSLPLTIKKYFRDAMKKTIQYTNELSDFDVNKIPIEQQICLLNAPDNVKEKAMQKLKEVKSKSEDSCSKARQYLDGLLKMPFNIYRKEPILCIMDTIKDDFKKLITKYPSLDVSNNNYSNIEIIQQINHIQQKICIHPIEYYKQMLSSTSKTTLSGYIIKINSIIESKQLTNIHVYKYKSKAVPYLTECINSFIHYCFENNMELLHELTKEPTHDFQIQDKINNIKLKYNSITNYTVEVKKVLDDAVYGHNNAKKQIERIIGQWINGEQDGYCFGFEGPPGVGKTSLAKRGLSGCLNDENGVGRPFAMIQMGGDSNGSSLHGHNYTYVGSTWGSIVQILIDKKCMNPIIFIDEVDKISKTEHGKEIVGILTHLLDPAQNDCFQDKYFTGIDLNLSKALFILSYNDVESIDKILLDRIHRIKFDSLSIEDKLIISKNHILPEIYKKMGLENIIVFDDVVLKHIIDNFTCEPGVRKLKEILFEIIAEINLDILKNIHVDIVLPILITIDDIKTKYFKEKHEIKTMKIHESNKIGVMNGLWANSLGRGGIIPIQACFFPSDKMFDFKLTGMQGDVMKESMNVSLSVAWNLTDTDIKQTYSNMGKTGIHIHCPEGATPKDGPSAGACITSVIYSLLNNKEIKNTIAITGEINLQGNVTEIGGLHLKFLGALKAGVKEFIYPEENQKDYLSFMEKYEKTDLLDGIIFHKVKNIIEVFDILF